MSDRGIKITIWSVAIGIPLLMVLMWGFWATVGYLLIVWAIWGFR